MLDSRNQPLLSRHIGHVIGLVVFGFTLGGAAQTQADGSSASSSPSFKDIR
jgi:hypothetical protein